MSNKEKPEHYCTNAELRTALNECIEKGKLTDRFALLAKKVFQGFLLRKLAADEEGREETLSGCFLRLLNGWQEINPESNVFSYLSGLANYVSLDYFRKRSKQTAQAVELDDMDEHQLGALELEADAVQVHESFNEANPDIKAVYLDGAESAIYLHRGKHVAFNDGSGKAYTVYQNKDGQSYLFGAGNLHELHLEAFGEELPKLPESEWRASGEAENPLKTARVNIAGVEIELCDEMPDKAFAIEPGFRRPIELATSPRPGGGLLVHVAGLRISLEQLRKKAFGVP